MSSVEIRSFRRSDGHQLAALVNAHAAAVVPGVSLSVNAVIAHLERQPEEFIVDPWVGERVTLVAEQRGRVVAAAHLLRYGDNEAVGESYRDAGEIRWFLVWPEAPFWPDSAQARDALIRACLGTFDRWGVTRQYADGTLPAPGVYGVPEQWPHIRACYEGAGFVHDGRTEIVYIAAVGDLPQPGDPPVPGLALRRSVGINGTRFSGFLETDVVGYVEVEALQDLGRTPRLAGLADIGNLEVSEAHRRRGIATWLLGAAGAWLRLGSVERVLGYAWPEQADAVAFLRSAGFRELTRTQRGWVRKLDPAS
jgi:ribosomal protein S18 acetylase RimI-like enzyme